ncbi:MAG: polymerase sigma-70 factor, subfamily [Frankiaceae bacterium]|nr:polymerase sigma-70 factor, subfamily [Frankiaceae bacterium]
MSTALVEPLPDEPSHYPDDDFTDLYRRYHPQLLRYVTCHFGPRDADEIAQEALTRALRALDRRRSDGETWAWLVRVARNIACDVARSRRFCEATDDDAVLHDTPIEETAQPEPAVLLNERRGLVRRALKALPPSQRRILVLYEVDELNCPTIAQLVGSTEYAVRKALQRARRSFAAEVQALGGGASAIVWGLRAALRRRPRGVSALTASTALCAFAGSLVLSVTVDAAPHVVRPHLAEPVASATTETGHGTAGSVTARVAAARATRGTGARAVAVARPGTQSGAVVRVPRTPLSPGQRTKVRYTVYVPVVGPVFVENELVTRPSEGIVCSRPEIDCD